MTGYPASNVLNAVHDFCNLVGGKVASKVETYSAFKECAIPTREDRLAIISAQAEMNSVKNFRIELYTDKKSEPEIREFKHEIEDCRIKEEGDIAYLVCYGEDKTIEIKGIKSAKELDSIKITKRLL